MAPVVPPTADPAARGARARRIPLAGAARPRPLPLRGAVLAAAAALGALVGLGVRTGSSLGRLGVVMLRLRGLPEFVAPDRRAVGAALAGGAHVALVAGAWGAAAAGLTAALARRGVGRPVQAGTVAALVALLAAVDAVLPTPLRLAAGALSPAERVLVAALVVVGGAAAVWRAPHHTGDPR